MTIEYLKCNFQVKNIFPKVPSRGVKVGKSRKFECFKVPHVGTLSLCLEMPNSMKKVWAQSDQCEPRKSPKTIENLLFWQFPIFWHILDVFSAQDDPIELKPFPLNQASRDTSLEYQQGVLWSTLKFQYFWLWAPLTPLEGTLGKTFLTRKLHFRYSIVIEHQIKHLAKIFFNKKGGITHPKNKECRVWEH